MGRFIRDALQNRQLAWIVPLAAAVLLVGALVWRHELRHPADQAAKGRRGLNRTQSEKILPLLPEQAPEIVRHEDIVRMLWRSFGEWRPANDPVAGVNAAALESALAGARERLASAGERADFDALLGAVVAAPQLTWALNETLDEDGLKYLDWQDGMAITKRTRELAGERVTAPLRVEVFFIVHDVSIPDASHDEIRLDMGIHSGAPPELLAQYMADNGMFAADEAPAVAERWKRADAQIGDSEKERANLALCLGVSPRERMDLHEREVSYNYGPSSRLIWRNAEITVTAPARFDTTKYPFDATQFTVLLLSGWDDASQLILAPYALSSPPLEAHVSRPPRGFYFSRQSSSLTSVTFQDNANSLAQPALIYSFQLSRRLGTAIWRTFVPLFLIVIFGLVATLRALATKENIGSIMTSLLPSLTIAGVALQLTASAAIPGNAGGTVMDKIFVSIYLQFFFLFLALNTHHIAKVSRVMLVVSLAAFVYGVHFFF